MCTRILRPRVAMVERISSSGRAPFGFSLMFNSPFDVFAELVAGVWFVEDPRVHVDPALGARYWF